MRLLRRNGSRPRKHGPEVKSRRAGALRSAASRKGGLGRPIAPSGAPVPRLLSGEAVMEECPDARKKRGRGNKNAWLFDIAIRKVRASFLHDITVNVIPEAAKQLSGIQTHPFVHLDSGFASKARAPE